ncbi:MAG: glycosyltransferase family 4 protein [Candidatus Aminicenantes bacterium]|nr:glycosyltransferase family 4 protein [Candidatus Aminicenantes bacterium]
MMIAVDGFELGREAKGVGRVVRNLMEKLPDLLPGDRFLVFTKERIGTFTHPRTEERLLSWRGGYLRWQNGPLRKALKTANPDLLVASNYVLPLYCPWKSILIEHDISVISHPEWYPRRFALTRRYLVRRSLERAGLVVVPSTFTGDEIQAFFGTKSDKIKPLGWGIEDTFRRAPKEEVTKWRNRHGWAGKKVIGFLGSVFKRRHIPELIRAVGLLREDIPEAVLHLVGQDFGVLRAAGASVSKLPEWVLWQMSLPEKELPLFYSSVDAFAYLSEYEGFGFPPLEALACGTPSVLLNGSSLSEVFSGLAFMVDAPEPEAIAAALKTAVSDETKRSGLLSEYDRRKERFSWRRTARELAALIRSM